MNRKWAIGEGGGGQYHFSQQRGTKNLKCKLIDLVFLQFGENEIFFVFDQKIYYEMNNENFKEKKTR